jgi:repressor of nif and glnA expression
MPIKEVPDMIGQESREVERKVITILKVLKDSPEPIGARLVARRLRDYGINLGERAVRYHLKLMDERGLTSIAGKKEGRLITQSGLSELDSALVGDRIGSAVGRIKMLTYKTSFNPDSCMGDVPINVSLFRDVEFSRALRVMRDVSSSRLCVSDLVAVADEGEKLGDVVIPRGKIGLATISSITLSGIFLKAGIPLDFRFSGILQIRNHESLRFVNLIEYTGSSLDPAEVFIASRMTSVSRVLSEGSGKILASFCELPALALPRADTIIKKVEAMGIRCLVKLGGIAESICETPVGLGKVGMILTDGLNMVAAAAEAEIEVENHAMGGVIDFSQLGSFWDLSTKGWSKRCLAYS